MLRCVSFLSSQGNRKKKHSFISRCNFSVILPVTRSGIIICFAFFLKLLDNYSRKNLAFVISQGKRKTNDAVKFNRNSWHNCACHYCLRILPAFFPSFFPIFIPFLVYLYFSISFSSFFLFSLFSSFFSLFYFLSMLSFSLFCLCFSSLFFRYSFFFLTLCPKFLLFFHSSLYFILVSFILILFFHSHFFSPSFYFFFIS